MGTALTPSLGGGEGGGAPGITLDTVQIVSWSSLAQSSSTRPCIETDDERSREDKLNLF